jgi:hypothetical protein
MSPIAGLTRLRKHQFGRQAVMGTKVAATRAYAFSGTPDVELNWTDPEVDAGSLDPVTPPTREGSDLTASLDSPQLFYNDLPLMLSGFFGGGEVPTGGGTAKTWDYDPASATVDGTDEMTYEFGDDVLTDWFQFGDGILETLEFTGPEGLGALTAAMGWRFASVASTGSTDSPVTGTVPTAGLSVGTADVPVYLKDMGIFIASSTAGLAAGQVLDALHTFTLRLSHEIDLKRYANGDQTFDIDAYGPGARAIELELTFAKTADTVGTGSESDAWMSDTAVNRWVRLTFTSTEMAEGIIPYSWTTTLPMRYYTRTEGEIGGNTTVVLTGHAFYDAVDLTGVFETTVVHTLASATLGSVPS